MPDLVLSVLDEVSVLQWSMPSEALPEDLRINSGQGTFRDTCHVHNTDRFTTLRVYCAIQRKGLD